MDRDYISDNQIVERYLQGKLSAEKQTEFEEALLSSVELLDEAEAAELLQGGLRDLDAVGAVSLSESRPSWLASMFNSPRYAMAASVLLLVSLGVSSTLLYRVGGQEGDGFAATAAQIVPLVSVRSAPGTSSVNTIEIGADGRHSVLMLDPGFEDYSHYRATVRRVTPGADPVRVWQIDRLRPGYEEMLALAVSSDLLEPGEYRVTIEGWRDEWSSDHAFETVDTVPFRVVQTPAHR